MATVDDRGFLTVLGNVFHLSSPFSQNNLWIFSLAIPPAIWQPSRTASLPLGSVFMVGTIHAVSGISGPGGKDLWSDQSSKDYTYNGYDLDSIAVIFFLFSTYVSVLSKVEINRIKSQPSILPA